MKTSFRYTLGSLFGLCLLGVGQASHAQYSGYYLGLFSGHTEMDFRVEFAVPVSRTDFLTFSAPFKSDGGVDGILVGYRFNDNVQVEASYMDFGESTGSLNSTGFFPQDSSVDLSAFAFNVVGNYPVTRRWHVYGKLGLAQSDSEIKGTDTVNDTAFRFSENASGLFYGVGTLLHVTRKFAVTADYQKFRFSSTIGRGDISVEALSLGLRFSF